MKSRKALIIACSVLLAACTQGNPPEPSENPTTVSDDPVATSGSIQATVIDFSDTSAGWINTNVDVEQGETLLLQAKGLWEVEGLKLQPRHVIWYRVGTDGVAYNLAANGFSFLSDNSGDLYLTVRPVGIYWDTPQGKYPAEFAALPGVDTGLSVRIFLNPQETLAAQEPPNGFSYLANLGRSEAWSDKTIDGHYTVIGEPTDDTGIIKAVLDLPLNRDTIFSFDWNYQAKPAAMAENNIPGHDYLSVALEFDNGRDLTWMRSDILSAGEHFRCPLPWWDLRETHFVIEDGTVPLSSWQTHQRNVLADYAEAIPGDLPQRIVGVWFIANNIFAKQPAKALFRNLKILQNGEELVLIPVES